MPSRKDLPFLLQLLDDETPAVRTQVSRELRAFGADLKAWTEPMRHQLNAAQHEALDEILAASPAQPEGLQWLDAADASALEQGLISLNRLYASQEESLSLSQQLDDLALHFQRCYPRSGSGELIRFLFNDLSFEGIDEAWLSYEHHQLGYLLERREGSPVVLASLATLLGHRLHIPIYTVHIQGHFMIMGLDHGGVRIYDPLQQGRSLPRASAIFMEESLRRDLTWPREMQVPASQVVMQILQDSVKNLKHSGRSDKADDFLQYQHVLFQEIKRRGGA